MKKVETEEEISYWNDVFKQKHPFPEKNIQSIKYIFEDCIFSIKELDKTNKLKFEKLFGIKFENYYLLENLIINENGFNFSLFLNELVKFFNKNIIFNLYLTNPLMKECFNNISSDKVLLDNFEKNEFNNVYFFDIKDTNNILLPSNETINNLEKSEIKEIDIKPNIINFIDYEFNENDKKYFLERYLNEYQDYELTSSYLSGMMDGDGSFWISSSYPYYTFVSLTQCDFLPIYLIYKKFGGKITKKENIGKKRNQYCLTYFHKESQKILNFIKDNILLKKEQVFISLENLNINRNFTNKNKLENLSNQIINTNKNHQIKTIEDKISWEYIAGLFDAEGCIKVGSEIEITQKNSPELLRKIIKFMGFGTLKDEMRLRIYGKGKMLIFFNNINNYLIVKKQYPYLLNYLEKQRVKYDISKDFYQEKLHHNYDIPKVLIDDLRIKLYKPTYEENIGLKNILSQKKIGSLNPNFGKERSKEHSQKISQSTFGKHRTLTDEQIKEILELKGKDTQDNIAEKYNVSRATIYKIYSGKLVPTTDFDKHIEKKEEGNKKDWIKSFGYTDEEANIINGALSKRTLEGKHIAIIWYYGKLSKTKNKYPIKLSAPKLSEYFTEKFNKKVSVDMIKNIWNKKTKLYKFDFETFNYQNYLDDKIDNEEWIEI